MRNERIHILIEVALSVALAAVLGLFKITLPWNFAGGSVSLSMLPIFVLALRRGMWFGILTGAMFGVLDYFMEPYFVHPVQVVLDYGVAFAACGLAGLGAPVLRAAAERGQLALMGALSVPYVLLGGLGRFAASVVSGVVFFAANAPEGQPVWLYSVVYNVSYLAPSLVACAILTAVLMPALERAVPARPSTPLSRA